VPLTGEARDALVLEAAPWREHRAAGYEQNERARRFDDLLRKITAEEAGYGVVNWSIDSFLFQDALDSEYRVDHWLLPFDDLVRTCAGQDLADRGANPKEWRPYAAYRFPTTGCPARRLTGVDTPKLRVFSGAIPVASPEAVAARLQQPGFAGDSLFVLEAPVRREPPGGVRPGARRRVALLCRRVASRLESDGERPRRSGAAGESRLQGRPARRRRERRSLRVRRAVAGLALPALRVRGSGLGRGLGFPRRPNAP
jgi:hypothetical protein